MAAPQRLQRDVGAEAVVHRARDQALAGERERLGGDHDRVADADQLGGLVAVGGADVDVQALELDHLLALLGIEQVQRLAADDARHRAARGRASRPAGRPGSGGPSRRSGRTRGSPSRRCGVTTRPISSMWPTTASSGDGLADAGHRGADAVGGERGEGGRLAPDRGRLAPRSPRGRVRAGACRVVQGFRSPRRGSMSIRTDVRSLSDSNSVPQVTSSGITALVTGASSGIGEATATPARARARRRADPRRPPRGAAAGAGRVAALRGELRRRRPHRCRRARAGPRPRRPSTAGG